MDMTTPPPNPSITTRADRALAAMVLEHMQGECGDGDACVTVSDRDHAVCIRSEILHQCHWLKDCTAPDASVFHLSDMSNENIWITWDPAFDSTLPGWVGLRIRWGHWR